MNRFALERKFLSVLYAQFPVIYRFNDNPKVTLSFDDGPEMGLTEKILEILNQNSIEAYFFVLVEKMRTLSINPEIYIQSGQKLGLHGINHYPVNITFNPDQWDQALCELNQFQNIQYFRPPYGIFSRKILDWGEKNHLKMMMWTITTYDYKSKNPAKWAGQIAESCKPGDILLLHDSPKTVGFYPDGLLYLIDVLKKKGLI